MCTDSNIFDVSRAPEVFQRNEENVNKNYYLSGEMIENSLVMLESVCSLLAIAIAMESRTTLPGRRQHYMETADRMRQCIRKLKRNGWQPLSPKGDRLVREILDDYSLGNDARQFCRLIVNIIEELEKTGLDE